MIEIHKKDETKIRVLSDDSGILMEISEHFTFYVDGYKYMPSFKNKTFDGKIRLFNLRDKSLPYGLLGELIEFCKSRDYTFDIDKQITNTYCPSTEELKKYVDSIPLSTRGQKIELRDYQFEGIANAIKNQRALTISPTASGKSAMIYMMCRWFLDNCDEDQKVLLVVPSTALVEQMKKDFIDYSEFDKNYDADSDVHQIYSGKEKYNIKSRIVLTTWQSAYKMPKQWFTPFGMVIGDESHLFKSKCLNELMNNLVNASYRIGTTGTIDNIQCNKLVLIGNFGPVYRVTSTRKLMDEDTLAKLNINCIVLKYEAELCKAVAKVSYQDEIDFIVSHAGRNRFIRNLALAQTGNTLVLFNYVEKHGKPLHKLISEKAEKGRKVFYISGGVTTLDREKIREIADKEKNCIINASLGCFSTGINLRNINTIIFASPTKSQIRVLQSIGRGLRKADDGRDTVLYDISDDFSWKSKKNFTILHAKERIKIYDSEQFEYKIFPIEMK